MAQRVLMCRPDYFGIEYEINPWMDKACQPNKFQAKKQWNRLVEVYKSLGVVVEFIDPVAGLPDMVFTANAGLVYENQIILSNFRPKPRRGEKPFFKKWFSEHGYVWRTLPEGLFFEGPGDVLSVGEKLVCGYGIRSSKRGVIEAARMAGREAVLLKLVDKNYYHLDTCFCPLKNEILFYPPAFDNDSVKKIESLGEAIPVSEADAMRFVCNAVLIYKNGRKLITTPMSKKLKMRLEKYDIEPIETNLSEFLKSGGAARCLTLFI